MYDEKKVSKSESLAKVLETQSIVSYNAQCVRKKSNWSKSSKIYKFDEQIFEPETLLKDIPDNSPKLDSLLKKIEELDRKDMKEHGKLFKHFIFSDLKSTTYGAKVIASALIAKGMKLGYNAPSLLKKKPKKDKDGDDDDDDESDEEDENKKSNPKKNKKRYGKIEMISDNVLQNTKNNNFYLLASISIYDQPINTVTKKAILANFNKRPDNIHGEMARIIVMDSGFKEGIDLFDIKYIHIYEPSTVASDEKQVIGRGTRTCGQKGLEFHPQQGWPLYVFVYDLSIPDRLQGSFMGSKSTIELYLKAMNLDIRLLNFAHDLEKTTVIGSVDYELNKAIHSFSIPLVSLESSGVSEHLRGSQEALYNGGGPKRRLVLRAGPPLEVQRFGFEDMRKHIREHFSEFMWTDVKMENLCEEKKEMKGGAGGQIISFTPTQDFVRHYFTPTNPVKGMLLHHSVGTGKCHAKDTPVLMFDGTIKMVQDVKVGDELMGDNSTPRKVLSLANGKDEMYDIIPVKGDKYTVNSEHILCLKYSGRGAIIDLSLRQPNCPFKTTHIDNKTFKIKSKSFKTREEANKYLDGFDEESKILEIEVRDYFKLSEPLRRDLKGYRKGVEFNSKPINFDPYIIGLWLGDGSSRGPVLSNQDSKILKYLSLNLRNYGLLLVYQSQFDYRFSRDGTTKTNLMIDELTRQNLISNKHIPSDYKINSRDIRLKLLAGIIDSDGYYCPRGKIYNITQKSDKLTNDILFLTRSLGFAAYSTKSEKSCMYKGEKKTGIYNSITISGNGLDEVPVLLTRKKAEPRMQIKDVLSTGINVVPIGRGDYYGFTLDGNNRYLLGDFTVTHNTCSAIAAATSNFEKQGYTILWVTRTTLKSDIWKNMFDMVCSDSIRTEIQQNNLQIPNEQDKRMRLLSKSWKIRPMSYKQFSNLVSKKNSLYNDLVKINGPEDPLRKTLLIIDEAHKLYGGDDLSSIEKPDMNALHQALMYSYQYSGFNSVKLLLMTATPITNNPMELIKLINLCKTSGEQMPADFTNFSEKYLNENGEFTAEGRTEYLDDIAGYVSYLNREKDARQFAQPIIQRIDIPIIRDVKMAERFDKKVVSDIMNSEIPSLRKQIMDETEKLKKGELSDLDPNKFLFLKDEICGDLEGKELKLCNKVVSKNIRELINEAKEEVKDIRENIKRVKALVKDQKEIKKISLKEIKGNVEENEEQYKKYKETLFYQLKNKCSKKITSQSELIKTVSEHPEIVSLDTLLNNYTSEIEFLHDQIKDQMKNHKNRLEHLKKILKKKDLSELEHSVIKSTIMDENRDYKLMLKVKKKDVSKSEKMLKKDMQKTKKDKKKELLKIRKTIKKQIGSEKKNEAKIIREEKKLRKTLRKQREIIEEIKDEKLLGLVDKYRKMAIEQFHGVMVQHEDDLNNKQQAKEMRIHEKEEARKTKKVEKEKEQQNKKEQKQREQERKKAEKEKEKIAKKAEKERQKATLKAEKEMNKRKTKKNK